MPINVKYYNLKAIQRHIYENIIEIKILISIFNVLYYDRSWWGS